MGYSKIADVQSRSPAQSAALRYKRYEIRIRWLRLAGHCYRHPELAAQKLVLWEPTHGTKRRGRQPLTYVGTERVCRRGKNGNPSLPEEPTRPDDDEENRGAKFPFK